MKKEKMKNSKGEDCCKTFGDKVGCFLFGLLFGTAVIWVIVALWQSIWGMIKA